MVEGEIIKFYRIKAGLTQEELGKGICSSKHVGKIERGNTSYSSEIISLFSKRLQIDIQKEILNFENVENKLQNWHTAIIKLRMNDVEKYKKDLEKSPFINSSKYDAKYQLLLARYYLLMNDYQNAQIIIQNIQKDYNDLPFYERNLLLHVIGIYYLNNYNNSSTENHQKAIQTLKKIDINEYGNPEYYYHLAVAYAWVDAKVMAYVNAEKALKHFKDSRNFLRAINAESIMLLQVGNDIHLDFKSMKRAYKNLIHDSEALNAPDKTGMLLNNFALEYYKRQEYEKAQKYYKAALQLEKKPSVIHLQRLNNYLKCSHEGKLMRKSVLLNNAQKGLAMAEELNNRHYQILFTLLILSIENNTNEYIQYIEKTAFPYFQSRKHTVQMKRYGKVLYDHYLEIKEFEKAIEFSNLLLNELSIHN
ncbi:helix-turn-helix domain-containing protein [Gottfriedia luciferensis]|uniref:helix-turn-helix domain-containing protein n=1 Tax=Gottfriedia luciferensis TaxID=178774 RepID=UPI000B42F50A|nr:helix-turn-helix domain-containing protein [Gottfriedia luciferensis]